MDACYLPAGSCGGRGAADPQNCSFPGTPAPDCHSSAPLSLFLSYLQPLLLCLSLLGAPLCPVWALTQRPLPEAPGQPQVCGLTAIWGSPSCHLCSATRCSMYMLWETSTSSARPQVSRAPVGWGGLFPQLSSTLVTVVGS